MKANWSCRKPLLIFVFFFAFISLAVTAAENELVVVTVATHTTDGFLRFNRSINQYGLKLEVLGLEEEWKGGDIARRPGGGQKILLLKKYLKSIIDEKKRIVLFTDSYDVIFTGGASEILKKFYSFDSNVVFSSEKYCWPNPSLATEYPKTDGKRYLNSGGFIGFASNLYTIVSHSSVDNEDDDQLYYTKIYLNTQLRNEINIKLDLTSYLFQNLNGAISDVEIRFVQSNGVDETIPDALLVNKVFQTQPVVVHGNGASKTVLNSLGNYLAKSWHPATGCLWCNEGRIDLNQLSSNDYPYVLVAVNILKPTPFLTEFFEDLTLLDYPKEKITVYIQSLVDYHLTETNAFVDDYKSFYKSVKYTERSEEWRLRNSYLDECVRLGCDYLLVLDTEARIINHQTLRELIEANKKIIAPMLVRPNEYWSNFWGALTHDGFYSRSHDYVQIIKNERSGIWNVPYIAQAYLLNASLLNEQNHLQSFKALSYGTGKDDEFDPDMYMCKLLRENGVFLYLTNLNEYGHLARLDTFDISRKHPDFYEIYSNEIEWRRRYIHENYSQVLQEDYSLEQPCPDVYWFPVTSPVFCQHLIEIMENFGSWSAGRNQDPRLSGGYENVPTVDIHMNQVGLEQHWLYFLRQYIRPVQEKVFIGYHHDPPKAIMNFVVRYHPKEQSFLRAHHDSSTYTINIALNRPKIDYEGGGCRFIRYNCSLTNLRLGWSLIHPGRLTHYHEGLTVTKGVRYIMVSFVDP